MSFSDETLRYLSKQLDPSERLAADQGGARWLAITSLEAGAVGNLFLNTGKRLVVLECGHLTLTRAVQRAKCRRCGEIIRSGYDYDGFRNRGAQDDFSWPEDPFREVHEAHAL